MHPGLRVRLDPRLLITIDLPLPHPAWMLIGTVARIAGQGPLAMVVVEWDQDGVWSRYVTAGSLKRA